MSPKTFAVSSSGTGSGTPAAPDTSIQFNDGGAFGGDADLVYDKINNKITLSGTDAIFIVGDQTIESVHADQTTYFFGTAGQLITLQQFGKVIIDNTDNTPNADNALEVLASGNNTDNRAIVITLAGTNTGVTRGIEITSNSNGGTNFDGLIMAGTIAGSVSNNASGANITENVSGTSVIHEWIGFAHGVDFKDTSTLTGGFGFYSQINKDAGATIVDYSHFWCNDLGPIASTNASYYFWADSRGVYRIREDNVADGSGNPQAITALYNPRFTKYTAGATNFERIVQQWVGNVACYGAERGGTGTLRALRLLGASADVQDGSGNYVAFKALTFQPTSNYLAVDSSPGATGTDSVGTVFKNGIATTIGSAPAGDDGFAFFCGQ